MPWSVAIRQLLRGFAMGAADIVPGVSGGTVALVVGIYERLIDNVHRGAQVLGHLLRRDLRGARSALAAVQWLWLITLLGGILTAIAVLSSAIERLLHDHPVAMAGLFTGLVAGSVVVARRLLNRLDVTGALLVLATGIGVFALLGLRTATEVGPDATEIVTRPAWIFLPVGAIAICAMILPGVSGSFLLVMMGMYTEVLGAVNDRDLLVLALFGLGCIVGLAAFSSVLSWLLEHHHDRVLASMIGLMLGSLRVLWPWPGGTATTTLAWPRDEIMVPVALAVLGLVVVIAVDRLARGRETIATPARAGQTAT